MDSYHDYKHYIVKPFTFYIQLEVTDNEYFENNIRCIKFGMQKNLEKLRKPPDKSRFDNYVHCFFSS